ncbi:response regulator [Burkholderia sp. Ac-20365]|uniref:response regulator transcription factor n=1 Tax=Burkholderia sp. Ac-20365 TaxID=2703897 RepID=UPI00197B93F0|nr:response regulator [Burkholderia sp. Ac-20365]MBN3765805.1 response regulator transcription factor [Burkholderia sp. Ac-20365]
MASGAGSVSTGVNRNSRMPVVYVIDDEESIRMALSGLLRSAGIGVELFESTADFLAAPRSDVPSCLILDVRLRGENGLTFQEEAAECGVHMPILFITGHGDIEMTVRAMKAGALDFFSKPFRDQDMLDAIAHALKRDAERLASDSAMAALRKSYESLTRRERDVMKLVVTGLLNKQIASELNLSEVTVKVYRGQVMMKMDAHSLADLVRKAGKLQIDPGRIESSDTGLEPGIGH